MCLPDQRIPPRARSFPSGPRVSGPPRCAWCGVDPLYRDYHDREWGVPLHDERGLFEFLILEGAQAGLSWLTILRKREGYRRAFEQFDAERVARFGEADVVRLLADTGIVRNRLKIEAAIVNARATLALREAFGGLDAYFWDFVDGRPVQNAWRDLGQVPATTPLSDRISKDLKQRGFKFVGSTIVYAHMQATGMVNDHTVDCFRHAELGSEHGGNMSATASPSLY
ncbi:MAG: hypothetical protein FD187_1551 [bacterium]|nr:MAG: hypothetical protein FD142_212 [bacterium]KAF0149003.1 MAG: hypothetical protein FD187_1551 [bacterium]KAF0165997.1 MAG: hypothetical protein FD158_2748 [bacterium]TXT17516.1 MAG: hypothetical protein FD132_2404 [bacterium]